MITIAIDRPQHTPIATIEMMASDNRIAQAPTVSIEEITADPFSATTAVRSSSTEAGSDGAPSITLPVLASEWNAELEREFSSLADKYVRRQLGDSEKDRFQTLTIVRRNLHHPRPVSEILYEQERTELLVDLLNALSRCVKFIDAKGQNFTRGPTQEKN